jgi:hypothetical protein
MVIWWAFPSWISETMGSPFLEDFPYPAIWPLPHRCMAPASRGPVETVSETVHQKQMFIWFTPDETLCETLGAAKSRKEPSEGRNYSWDLFVRSREYLSDRQA